MIVVVVIRRIQKVGLMGGIIIHRTTLLIFKHVLYNNVIYIIIIENLIYDHTRTFISQKLQIAYVSYTYVNIVFSISMDLVLKSELQIMSPLLLLHHFLYKYMHLFYNNYKTNNVSGLS